MSSFTPSSDSEATNLVSAAHDAISMLISKSWKDQGEKVSAEKNLCVSLFQIEKIICGEINDVRRSFDVNNINEKANIFVLELQKSGLVLLLIENLVTIPFEGRKDFTHIFTHLIRRNTTFVTYIHENSTILSVLVKGYTKDIALLCGLMLRECINNLQLVSYLLQLDIWLFFDYVQLPNFDIASDAFNTLKELLITRTNPMVASEFIELNYDLFLTKYNVLLQSENYVTRMRSIKLLGEILIDRNNFNVMMKYIGSKENLKTIMNLLRHKSPNITFEAFHVFKLFVANPNKTKDIKSILSQNKPKLVSYLQHFHIEKDDEQFHIERNTIIENLKTLPDVKERSNSHLSERSPSVGDGRISLSTSSSLRNSLTEPLSLSEHNLSQLSINSTTNSSGVAEEDNVDAKNVKHNK